jgi:molecular chaperone GrpE (heat shock protein)
MAFLDQDIILNEAAFDTASADMEQLKNRTEKLKEKLHSMYHDLTTALNTPAGEQLELTGEKVIVKPIEDMIAVIDHISNTLKQIMNTEDDKSNTLEQIKDTRYYKDVFIKYEELNQNINL